MEEAWICGERGDGWERLREGKEGECNLDVTYERRIKTFKIKTINMNCLFCFFEDGVTGEMTAVYHFSSRWHPRQKFGIQYRPSAFDETGGVCVRERGAQRGQRGEWRGNYC